MFWNLSGVCKQEAQVKCGGAAGLQEAIQEGNVLARQDPLAYLHHPESRVIILLISLKGGVRLAGGCWWWMCFSLIVCLFVIASFCFLSLLVYGDHGPELFCYFSLCFQHFIFIF